MPHTPGPWGVRERLPESSLPFCVEPYIAVTTASTERDEANARLMAASPELLRIARILESFRQSGANSISFSALMHDGDDTLGQAVAAVIAKVDGSVCDRCEGDGKAHGSDRPFESSGPGTYPGPCPKCGGTGKKGGA